MRSGAMARRRGATTSGVGAAELLVALLLTAAVAHLAWRVFAVQRLSVEEIRLRTEVLDTDRAVRTVLGAELAAGVAGRDWSVVEPGVVELRAFRGWGAACPEAILGAGGGAGAGSVLVAYRGLRVPDPDKDSVLALDGDGRWTAADLTSRAATGDGCPAAPGGPFPGAALERWTLDPPVPGAVLLRVYESGSYHLVDGSLRYRRGAGGRQPLTPAVLDRGLSGVGWAVVDKAAVVSLHGAEGRGGGWARRLFGNGGWGG